VVTLVGAALTLPAVLAWLKVEDDNVSEMEERKALGAMAAAALARVDELERRGQLEPQTAGIFRRRHQRRKAHIARNRGDGEAQQDTCN
jgi:hypothetical protein